MYLSLTLNRRPIELSAEAEEGEAPGEPKSFCSVCNITCEEILGACGGWGLCACCNACNVTCGEIPGVWHL